MTAFDIAVLIIVGLGAFGGFLRGFVQETLALCAWFAAIFAIRAFHTPLTAGLLELKVFEDPVTTAVLAFALLLLVPYGVMKLIANWAGKRTRASVLSPIDRLLGLGFGVLKGTILVVLAFSILALGYDSVWGAAGRPEWISQSRSYPLVNAASQELVRMIAEQRERIRKDAEREAA